MGSHSLAFERVRVCVCERECVCVYERETERVRVSHLGRGCLFYESDLISHLQWFMSFVACKWRLASSSELENLMREKAITEIYGAHVSR